MAECASMSMSMSDLSDPSSSAATVLPADNSKVICHLSWS